MLLRQSKSIEWPILEWTFSSMSGIDKLAQKNFKFVSIF